MLTSTLNGRVMYTDPCAQPLDNLTSAVVPGTTVLQCMMRGRSTLTKRTRAKAMYSTIFVTDPSITIAELFEALPPTFMAWKKKHNDENDKAHAIRKEIFASSQMTCRELTPSMTAAFKAVSLLGTASDCRALFSLDGNLKAKHKFYLRLV